jgi:hypothetical protein
MRNGFKRNNREITKTKSQILIERLRTLSKSDIWSGLIPALGLFIFSIAFSIQGQSDARTGMRSMGWNVARGEVIRTYVVCNTYTDSRRSRYGSSFSSRTSCAAVINYRYYVKGTEYTGKRFRISAGGADAYTSINRTDCEQWGRKHFPPGTDVRVHYDPLDPNEAALQAGVSTSSYVLPALGSILAGLGCFMALLAAPMEWKPSLLLRILISLAVVLLVSGINILVFPGMITEPLLQWP